MQLHDLTLLFIGPHTLYVLCVRTLSHHHHLLLLLLLQTTAHTISWTLFLLATHPEAEARLCAELNSLGLLAKPGKPAPTALQWEHLAQVSCSQQRWWLVADGGLGDRQQAAGCRGGFD